MQKTDSPYRIGLTGNIATGKSTVAATLAQLGAAVFDADRIVHEIMAPGGPAYAPILAAFGPAILTPHGTIDRRALGAIVFSNPAALNRLEKLTHPLVLEEVERRIAAGQASVVVIEAIKLIEAGSADRCDALWVTTCPQEMQVERLIQQRGLSEAEARQRIAAQPAPQAKLDRATVIINTGGSLEATRAQVEAAWHQIFNP